MDSAKSRKTYIVVIAIVILLAIIGIASYSFFNVGNFSITNVANVNTITEKNNMSFDAFGGNISLNVTVENMAEGDIGNIAAENNATMVVFLQPNTSGDVLCSYDIIYEWTSSDKYQSHTPGVTDIEIGIQAISLTGFEGANYIRNETDLADFVGPRNSVTVVSGATVDSTYNIANWSFIVRFHNVNADQSALSNKSFAGRFKVTNVKCGSGKSPQYLTNYLVDTAPKSGTDAVSNSPWILTSDHASEWRYAGKNPDNYIEFNGELWRIIGVMPNMEYCTGIFGTEKECDTTATGSLVKITRNQIINSSFMPWDYKSSGVGSSAASVNSSDWSDSQLMLMLNGTNYLKTAYDVNGNKLHQSYTITNNVVNGNGYDFYNTTYSYLDGNGQTVYKPSEATKSSYTATSGTLYKKIESNALSQIATAKWSLYSIGSYNSSSEGTPIAIYNKEKNINGLGEVPRIDGLLENRPEFWYGKIGLMYASDYGYATNGGSTYNRNTCLGYYMYGWSSGNYKTDCAGGSYLWYDNITSSSPGTSGTSQSTISPFGITQVAYLGSNGAISTTYSQNGVNVRPVLYLKPDIIITGGTGTYDDPYTIERTIVDNSMRYWFAIDGSHTFPSYGDNLKLSGDITGSIVHIGQDMEDYYACATISGHEICLKHPYTRYGLSGHTLNSSFTTAQQNSAKQAIFQALTSAGIDVDINDCEVNNIYANCGIGADRCGVNYNGEVYCAALSSNNVCMVYSNGSAECSFVD